uniref:RING finger protein 37 n=1 Tax=Cacopsylla melanoneura TaxID=428564 RepID=A0A8D8TWK2_9HEMI
MDMIIKPSMRVNFMQNILKTTVSSPQVSCDGYSITNLLSNTGTGFLTEHFMKPPVFIEIEFMCNVYIHGIVVNTRLGTQKSKGIEILINDTTVGKCYLNSEQDTVQWVRRSNLETNELDSKSESVSVSEFYSGAHRQLNSTKRIMLKIFKTESSSLVAIKSLKIIGSINKRTNSREVVDEFVSLLYKLYPKQNTQDNKIDVNDSQCPSKTKSSESNLTINTEDIPEDFLDPITHEFMTNPFTLPCGKIIDQVTLDKYLENELKWNRLPNDPFTNVKFNERQKPIQALQLKSRIDKFLFLNRNHAVVEKLPRTFTNVYSNKRNGNLLFKMLENEISSECVDDDLRNRKFQTEPICKTFSNNDLECKRRKLCSSSEKTNHTPIQHAFSNHYNLQNGENIFKNSLSKNATKISSQTTTVTRKTSSVDVDIVDLTNDNLPSCDKQTDSVDLDSQIQNTLQNLPSFIKDSASAPSRHSLSLVSHTPSMNYRPSCFNCNSTMLLYRITKCSHHVCRICLSPRSELVCGVCDTSFSTGHVIRIYNS